MDLAKLLQENALGGEVLLSQATYDLVQHIYHCEPIEPRKALGEKRSVESRVEMTAVAPAASATRSIAPAFDGLLAR